MTHEPLFAGPRKEIHDKKDILITSLDHEKKLDPIGKKDIVYFYLGETDEKSFYLLYFSSKKNVLGKIFMKFIWNFINFC